MNEKWTMAVQLEIDKHGTGDPEFVAAWLRAQADWIVEHWDELAGECRLRLWRESE